MTGETGALHEAPNMEGEVDTRLRWSDGLYGGLVAGIVVSIFFSVVDVVTHEPIASVYVVLASAILGTAAHSVGTIAIILGVAMLFLSSAIGGIFYALLSRKIGMLVIWPYSTILGFVYGFLIWLFFIDVVVPMSGMQATIDRPLWISAVGIGFFYGSALCEYLANIARSRAKSSESESQPQA